MYFIRSILWNSYYARERLISILRQTIILEKVTAARYKIQPVYLTKNKDKTLETNVNLYFSCCSSKKLLTSTSVFWIQYLTETNGLYFSFYIKITTMGEYHFIMLTQFPLSLDLAWEDRSSKVCLWRYCYSFILVGKLLNS